MKSTALTGDACPNQAEAPTLWGLSVPELHDRFWASRGVEVVRRGTTPPLSSSAELFLLIDPLTLVVFRIRDLVEVLSWLSPQLVIVRLRDRGRGEYKEVIQTDVDGRFAGLRRIYEGLDSRLARIGVTASRAIAERWKEASTATRGWQILRAEIAPDQLVGRSMPGRVFDASRPDQLMSGLEYLLQVWGQPDSTIGRVTRGVSGAWADESSRIDPAATLIGPVWVGAGRALTADDTVVGPAVLWDAPGAATLPEGIQWQELEPLDAEMYALAPRRISRARRAGKRIFDIVFSITALALTVPLYPLIALAIWIEDGWPVFFSHRRETLGGREFPCLKFRSMRKDAERMRDAVRSQNRSDGPQFFVERDPRSTRVGQFLRTTQLDEIPQFWNVLVGHMSVVGPRPSPRRENQYCPAWREARLSVRPGITGLWQIQRTRAAGLDFQEWIRFDLEYVQRMNWRLDIWILWRTVCVVFGRMFGRK